MWMYKYVNLYIVHFETLQAPSDKLSPAWGKVVLYQSTNAKWPLEIQVEQDNGIRSRVFVQKWI